MLADDDLWRLSRDELIHHVQRLQHEKLTLLHEHGSKMKDVNQRLQTHLLEIRTLKEVIKSKQDDNQELRELCCFLDDDRQKYKKLSKEWQRFGRYTSSVIKTEVASHQTKFKDISAELDSLLKYNEELKELVIFLDDERSSALRDQGDGSSGNSDDNPSSVPPSAGATSKPELSPANQEAMKYIEHLEQKIELLEAQLQKQPDHSQDNPWLQTNNINQAMKVLAIHNSLDRPSNGTASGSSSTPPSDHQSLDTNERTLLRELCSVAWKTLEEEASTKPSRPLLPQNSRV